MSIKCSILLFLAAAIGFAACKNDDEVFKPVVSTYINIVNASADTINIYLNGTRQNNSSSLIPRGQSFYLTVPAGQQSFQFKKAGSSAILFSIPLNMKDSVYHSLYVAGETADKAFSTVDSLFIDSAFAQVRFVNASPDAGNLNVTVGDTVSFKARAFKTSSSFLPVGSGLKEVRVYLEGSLTPKIDTLITMEPNRGYTLFTKGMLNGKGGAVFNVGVAVNF